MSLDYRIIFGKEKEKNMEYTHFENTVTLFF